MKRAIGKNTLGSGKKMNVSLRNYERSTHDLSYIWRSTMAPGTLVPFMKQVGLTGDTFDINLEANVMTHPTIGPLFGSFKLQLDVFTADMRLYQGKLHMNKLGVGLDMAKVKLPVATMRGDLTELENTVDFDTSQINPSSIWSYLGVKGIGEKAVGATGLTKYINALPYLSYWDIYKNYYANKQEPNGVVIHNSLAIVSIDSMSIGDGIGEDIPLPKSPTSTVVMITADTYIFVYYSGIEPDWSQILLTTSVGNIAINLVFTGKVNGAGYTFFDVPSGTYVDTDVMNWNYNEVEGSNKPQLVKFPLVNIDTMRENILIDVKSIDYFYVLDSSISPYGLSLKKEGTVWSRKTALEGLAIKTYQSDQFNNWINTEWLNGANGVNELSKISTTGGSFTIDALTLKRKVYNMLNAIAISGGSYDDWLDVNWSEERHFKTETPEYHGGLSKEIVFQEVINQSASEDQPLGTLAGRGVLGKKHKGGYVRISVKEPCYVMGIVSITPRIDYYQGNDWDTNVRTMDDWHKPALDGIGFQDLITDGMAWWDTKTSQAGTQTFKSAGKQPAWLNYMTNVNRVYGNFAIENEQKFMVLVRRYEQDQATKGIKDLTTYIDPSLYNHIFAYTQRDAQNFWVQIGVNMEVRRKMSAKIMPQG